MTRRLPLIGRHPRRPPADLRPCVVHVIVAGSDRIHLRSAITAECSIRRRVVRRDPLEVESTVTLSHRYLGIEVSSKRGRTAVCQAFRESLAGLWSFTHDDSVKLTAEGEDRRRRLEHFMHGTAGQEGATT